MKEQADENQSNVPDIHKIIQIAGEAGRIVLENGGETHLVEEAVTCVCERFEVKDASCFATPTGIMLSAIDHNGHTASLVKRIHSRTTNLAKIARVNDLVFGKRKNPHTPESFAKALTAIDRIPFYDNWQIILAACFCASCFTIVYGGNWHDFIVSFVIGGIIKTVSLLLERININNFFTNIICGGITAFIALLSVKFGVGENSKEIIIGALMLLVPGLAVTNAIRDTIMGDIVAGTARAVEALLVAVAIAVGAGAVLRLWYFI